MEEEIDLRPHIEALLTNWLWIAGTGFVLAVVVYVISLLISPTYQATALVAIAEPRQRVQFDARIETVAESQPLKAYPELALSDGVLTNLLAQDAVDATMTLEELQDILEAEAGSDPSLLRLVVSHQNPETAASIVNQWAELFVNWANQVYGFQGDAELLFFQEQLQQAEVDLTTSEQALIDFEARNRTVIVNNELAALQSAQADYLNMQQEISFLIQDVNALRSQLTQDGSNITVADQITALFLEMKAFNVETDVPLQFQFDTLESLTQQTQEEQIRFLTNLGETLSGRVTEIEGEVAELEPQILALQEEAQNLALENGRLGRNHNIAKDTYTALARKIEEERITSQEVSSGVRLASRSAVPINPVAPRKLINAVVAGSMGVLIAVFVILTRGWWRTQK